MDPIGWIQTILQRLLSVFEPPDSRMVILAFYGIGIYLFANYGTLNNETIAMWTIGAYIGYALADPTMGSNQSDDASEKTSSTSSDENQG